jgi:cbb3-type cytochrome c oxidase subunit III
VVLHGRTVGLTQPYCLRVPRDGPQDMKPLHALTLLVLLAGAAHAAETKPAFKPDLAKGQAIAAQACAACHTSDGSRGSPANPILQGQHPEYLVKQLQEFKSGKRKNAIMMGFASTLSDEDMRHVAAYFGSKVAKPGAARNKDTIRLGEKIYRGGILQKNVPACAGCHGPTGAGIPAQFPRLGGQHADYTESQMNAFRSGARGNSAQMSAIALRMTDTEIKAVSDYIAGLR